jgi:ribulose-5-phosphate 4-epimerase/fuculose-1-phosphate aldolase
MFATEDIRASCPALMDEAEWGLRLQLAACYRVFEHRGWVEEIFNHITLRVPGAEPQYLINPFGLNYGEITAHNLLKVDRDGRVLHDSPHTANRAGFMIHGAIHAARANAHCIIHTHHTAGLAVACQAGGLSMDNFYAAFLDGRVAYHDFEGVTVHEDERSRLIAHLGDKTVLILRNHGLLVAERDVASAFYWMYVLQRACEVQARSQAMGPTLALTPQARKVSSRDMLQTDPQGELFEKVFAAAVRRASITLAQLADPR